MIEWHKAPIMSTSKKLLTWRTSQYLPMKSGDVECDVWAEIPSSCIMVKLDDSDFDYYEYCRYLTPIQFQRDHGFNIVVIGWDTDVVYFDDVDHTTMSMLKYPEMFKGAKLL